MFFDADSAYYALAETETRGKRDREFIEGFILGVLIKRWLRRRRQARQWPGQ